MGLNSEQLAAMATRRGYYNIIALAGTGKTTVFTHRAAAILREGTPARKFLGVTFTKSAAEQLESRTIKAGYKPADNAPRIFRTFHGWALDFAKQEFQNFPFQLQRFPLLTPHEKYKILVPVIKAMDKRPKYKDLQEYISQMKRKDVSPEQAIEDANGEIGRAFARAYGRYEEKCKQSGRLDFDSLLTESVNVLETRPDVLARWQPDFLQCDEAQDNDKIQWRLIQLLGGKNVFVVGDPNQNMYTWRGAQPAGLTTEFNERFPGAKRLALTLNYRSTIEIIEYLNEIMPMKEGLLMQSGLRTHGPKPTFMRYLNEDHEAELILNSLPCPENTAILARTNKQLSAFEKAAGKLEMKYKLLGKSGFFSQPEVEFTVAFAQYCAGAATDDSIKKILGAPYDACRFIKKHDAIETLERMQAGAVGRGSFPRLLRDFHSGDSEQDNRVRNLRAELEDCRKQVVGKSSQDALRNVITRFGILNHYQDEEHTIDNNPADNVMSLLRMAEKRGTLLEFVHLCHKAKMASRSTAKRLTFATCHAAKGLEWEHVYVIGVNPEIMPHKEGDPEEEKRIYFVACSRAVKTLQVSCNEGVSSFIKHKLPVDVASQGEVDFLQQMYTNASQGVPS